MAHGALKGGGELCLSAPQCGLHRGCLCRKKLLCRIPGAGVLGRRTGYLPGSLLDHPERIMVNPDSRLKSGFRYDVNSLEFKRKAILQILSAPDLQDLI
jgi:hypothetical protein